MEGPSAEMASRDKNRKEDLKLPVRSMRYPKTIGKIRAPKQAMKVTSPMALPADPGGTI
jgi:hypothetical protein